MSVTWFTIKTLFVSFVIISVLQLKVGANNKSLETHLTSWMKRLSASQRIQNVAKGGKDLTSDVIKEFTTEDGSWIRITQPGASDSVTRDKEVDRVLLKDNKVVKRLVNGFKLDVSDLTEEAKKILKKQLADQIAREREPAQKKEKSQTEIETSQK